MAVNHLGKSVQDLRQIALPRGDDLTDGQLLGRYVEQRDQVAFEILVHRHGAMVIGVCRRLLRNEADVEDAFQAVFLVLVRKANSVNPRELVGNWLYGVAVQTARKAAFVSARQQARERQVADMPEPAAQTTDLQNDLRPLLDRELQRLPEKYRVPIVLCGLEGKAIKEAARQLGWPEGTVAGRLSRARDLLAKRLTRSGLAFSGSLGAVLAAEAASASVPNVLMVSTLKAANLYAAGHAATAGVISAKVAALTEGVTRAMFIAKLRTVAAVLFVGVFTSVGLGVLTYLAAAERQVAQERKAGDQAAEKSVNTINGKVVGVPADGKGITVVTSSTGRGEDSKTEVKFSDKTEITYEYVGANGAKPTVGYQVQAQLSQGADTAEKVVFTDTALVSHLSGKVTEVSKDGKAITVAVPQRDNPNATFEFVLTDKTKVGYSGLRKGQAALEGHHAEVWLEGGVRGEGGATKVIFSKPTDQITGKVVGVAKDGSSITVETLGKDRTAAPDKVEIKITPTTELVFRGVGADQAKLAEGLGATVWLQEESKDTALRLLLRKVSGEGRR